MTIVKLSPKDPFVGEWVPADLYSDIVIAVEKEVDDYRVCVYDSCDGERAEVYDIQFDGTELSFNVHWSSNGRFIKYGLLLCANDTVRLIYTYSGQETWVRKEP
ncbi:MAG: hypothetical protein ACRBBW_07105 [Cellvibrionaceae bacterium]